LQRYWSRKTAKFVEGPYQDRKKIMGTLCRQVGVRYFRVHALRQFEASVPDRENVSLGSIQRILGHENRTTTKIYLHSMGEAERKAMVTFEQATQDRLPAKILTQVKKEVRPKDLTPRIYWRARRDLNPRHSDS